MQRYKLRLGDGTVLIVDYEGLGAWLQDKAAVVQAVGSKRWRPLKAFMADERVMARRAAREKPVSRDALPLVYPKPKEEEPPPPSVGEPPGVQALADEPSIPRSGPGRPAPASDAGPPSIRLKPLDDLPPIPLKPLDHEAPLRAKPPAPSVPAEPRPIAEPPALQVLADEPGTGGPASRPRPATSDDDLPPIRLKPLEDEAAPRPAPPWRAPLEPGPEPATARPSPPPWSREDVPSPLKEEKQRKRPKADARPPVVRPKPPVARAAAPPAFDDEPGIGEALLAHPLTKTLLRAASRLGSFLSRCLDPVNRLERGLSPFPPLEEGAAWGASDSSPEAPLEPGPSARAMPEIGALADAPLGAGDRDAREVSDVGPRIRLKALVESDAFRRVVARLRERLGRASAWVAGLTARVAGLTARIGRAARQDQASPSTRSSEPEVAWPGLEPPAPLKAPPPIGELPALRLAPTREPKQPEDVYDGEDVYGRLSFVHTAWHWTKRLVIITGLVAGGAWAVLSWQTWKPKAEQVGQVVFTEIDGRVRATQQAEAHERALAEAVERVPQLARATIKLVLSSSPTGALEPPEVFRLAREAADRGTPALSAEEAQELARLRVELLAALTPAERNLVSDYESVRSRRSTFAFEDRDALRLYARGARALASLSLGRLRALSGKAVAAGLAGGNAAQPRLER